MRFIIQHNELRMLKLPGILWMCSIRLSLFSVLVIIVSHHPNYCLGNVMGFRQFDTVDNWLVNNNHHQNDEVLYMKRNG